MGKENVAVISNSDIQLRREIFENPPKEYSGTPFWAWNCHITSEKIMEQVPVFEKMGMGGFMIHPRVGLDIPYMGSEYLSLVRTAVMQAKKHGMKAWLYDEDNFPSGYAGGIVTKKREFRARHLILTHELMTEDEDTQYLCSYEIALCGDKLKSYQRLSEPAEKRAGFVNWNLYRKIEPWRDDKIPYVDVLNKNAIEYFIKVTYSAYEKAVGDEFGKTIPAIFTDEPQMNSRFTLYTASQKEPVTLAYTDDFNSSFQEEYGVEFLDILPEILWELPDGKLSLYRYLYNEHLSKRFKEAYHETIGKWCGEHNISFTGHLMSERTLFQQTFRLGDAMRHYSAYQIPGVDILCGDLEFSTVKQAVSVARQYGKEGVVSELYGVTNWDFDFKGHKLQGDWQAALGITHRVHHLAYCSMAGEGKRDWPASIFYQSPWYEKYGMIEKHFARLNTALTRGKAIVRIAVVHPIESFWMIYGINEQTMDKRLEMDENFENMISWLLFHTLDFDFLSEALLPEEHVSCEKELNVGIMSYRTIILPDLITIRSTTLHILEQFMKSGGRVICVGQLPEYVDGKKSDEAKKALSAAIRIPFGKAELLKALNPDREISLHDLKGCASDNLFTQMREDNGCRWLFICHVRNQGKQIVDRENYCLKIKGQWNLLKYDTLTGNIAAVDSHTEGADTVMNFGMYAQDNLLLKLVPLEVQQDSATATEWSICISEPFQRLKNPFEVIYEEPNVLLLDKADYSLDKKECCRDQYVLTIDDKVREELSLKNMQPYMVQDNSIKGELELYYHIESDISLRQVELAIEAPEDKKITWNGRMLSIEKTGWFVDKDIIKVQLPKLSAGENLLKISYGYRAKSKVEPCYLLGNFGVERYGNRLHLTRLPAETEYGDITTQGRCFYSGNMIYRNRIDVELEKEIFLTIPYFEAPVIEVFMDGESKGLIAFAPHRISLGRAAAGEHVIDLKVYGNRYNCFAPLHVANPDFKWYGPLSFRTNGENWINSYMVRPFGIMDYPELSTEIHM